jgi:hypothetical protein
MLAIVGNDELAGTASEVRRRLAAAVDRAAQHSDDPNRPLTNWPSARSRR